MDAVGIVNVDAIASEEVDEALFENIGGLCVGTLFTLFDRTTGKVLAYIWLCRLRSC